jgi:hypothetical protein
MRFIIPDILFLREPAPTVRPHVFGILLNIQFEKENMGISSEGMYRISGQ